MVSALVTLGDDSATVASWYASSVRKGGGRDSNRVAGIGDEAHIRMSPKECMIHARKGKYQISFYLRPSERSTREEFVRVAGEVVASL